MPQTIAKPVEKGWSAETQLERMLAYNVFDKNDEKIGHVSGLWTEAQDQIAFVGVKTSWLSGRTHVIPAQGMQVNHQRETIRVPYAAEIVKDAPTYDPGEELDYTKEQEVYAYYSRFGLQRRPAQGAAAAAQAQGKQERQDVRIPLTQEQVKVGKREVEAGGIRLKKIVRTETVNQPVELRREEAVIERVPAQGARPGEKAFQFEDVYIPLRQEEAVVGKEAVVREELRVRKSAQTDKQEVSEQVRKEDVEIEKTGDASRVHTEEGAAANRLREYEEKPRSQRQKQ